MARAVGDVFVNSQNLYQVKTRIRTIDNWVSIPGNMVMADSSGNIAYALFSSVPKRKNSYPYLGNRVLDGQTSKHDWDGVVDMINLPFVINPEKGYFATANGRIVPENSKFDFGASMVATARSQRIKELIEEGIKSGKKFDHKDMVDW